LPDIQLLEILGRMSINLLHLGFWASAAVGLWVAVFRSPLVVHLMEHFIEGEFHTHKDVEKWLLENQRWALHTVWTCPVCQAVWTSAAAALGFSCATPVGWWTLPCLPLFLLVVLPYVLWIQKKL
jgi:hypothetical protein